MKKLTLSSFLFLLLLPLAAFGAQTVVQGVTTQTGPLTAVSYVRFPQGGVTMVLTQQQSTCGTNCAVVNLEMYQDGGMNNPNNQTLVLGLYGLQEATVPNQAWDATGSSMGTDYSFLRYFRLQTVGVSIYGVATSGGGYLDVWTDGGVNNPSPQSHLFEFQELSW